MTITPATYDFVVYRNGDVRQDVTINVDAVALDLTGYVARLEVRPSLTDATVAAIIDINSTTPTANGSTVSFPDAVNGVLQIFIDDQDMFAFALSKAKSGAHAYVYDLILTAPGGDVDPYLAGSFTVHNGVTR